MTDFWGWFMPRWRRPEPSESLAPPAPTDLDQLDQLAAAGSRLTLPHPVRSFVRFASEKAARDAGAMVAGEHVKVQVRAGQDGSWTLTVIQLMIPTPGAVTRLRERMTELAEAHAGEYVGWSAPAVY